jgi:hypothetical protein
VLVVYKRGGKERGGDDDDDDVKGIRFNGGKDRLLYE